MRRVAFEVRLEVEVPDDAPDPELVLKISGTALVVRAPGGSPVSANGRPAPTRDEEEAAMDAAVALLPPSEFVAVEEELGRVGPGNKPGKVRGHWVQRVYTPNTGKYDFAVYEGGLPGVTESCRQAATRILRAEQRRKMGAL